MDKFCELHSYFLFIMMDNNFLLELFILFRYVISRVINIIYNLISYIII